MPASKKVSGCCCLVPLVLVASCAAKINYNIKMYNLPGEVLISSTIPTRNLVSAIQVAETLDAYVQPRFEILRDNFFGTNRIEYRKHAGIVQLKVDTPHEKELIANVNGAHREYAIGLLHCIAKPNHNSRSASNKLQLLYFNQQQIASSWAYDQVSLDKSTQIRAEEKLSWDELEKKAIAAIPQFVKRREYRTKNSSLDVLMRPVLASKIECINCHTNANPDSTLGVMVYAVRSDRNKPIAQIGMK